MTLGTITEPARMIPVLDEMDVVTAGAGVAGVAAAVSAARTGARTMLIERLGLLVRESSMDEEFKPLRSRVVMHEPPAGFIVSQGDTISLITTARKREKQSL